MPADLHVISPRSPDGATPAAAMAFTPYDLGWVVLCIGMAIGAGVVFLPVQMGVKGVLVSVLSLAIAYPMVYLIQSLYIASLSATRDCDDYAQVITQYLGRNWGMVLGAAYFLALVKSMFGYASAITQDVGSYLETFGVVTRAPSGALWFLVAVIGTLVLVASAGERLLFRIAGPLIMLKLAIVVLLGVAMAPHWDIANLAPAWSDIATLFCDVVLTLPFAMFSIYFVQILNPMNVAYRKVEPDPVIATRRAQRAMRVAYGILVVAVLFFCLSFLLSISRDDAVRAADDHISGLALAARVMPGAAIQVMSTLLNVAAIFTAFFGVYLGFHDALRGIVLNVLDRFVTRSTALNRLLPLLVGGVAVLILVTWVRFGPSTMLLMQIAVPIQAFVACLLPAYLVWRIEALRPLRSWRVVAVFLYGLVLMSVPVMKLFER